MRIPSPKSKTELSRKNASSVETNRYYLLDLCGRTSVAEIDGEQCAASLDQLRALTVRTCGEEINCA